MEAGRQDGNAAEQPGDWLDRPPVWETPRRQRPTHFFDHGRRLWERRSFRIGLALKLLAVVFLAPTIQDRLFLPFVGESLWLSPLDPWSEHIDREFGAFPYGAPMVLYFGPAGAWAAMTEGAAPAGAVGGLGMRLSLLLGDFILLWALSVRYARDLRQIIRIYWLSPVVFFVTYWHGQLDVVPTFLLVTALVLLLARTRLPPPAAWSGRLRALFRGPHIPIGSALLGFAVAAKLSMAVALPFIAVLVLRNRRWRHVLRPAAVMVFIAAGAVAFVPWLVGSSGFRGMVLGTPQLLDVYELAIVFDGEDGTQTIYLLPLILAGYAYLFYRARRPSAELMLASVGICYLLIVSLTPASPGWFLWVIPFVISYAVGASRAARMLLAAFELLVVGTILLEASGPTVLGLTPDLGALFSDSLRPAVPERFFDIALTLRSAAGLLLAGSLYMYADWVHREIPLSRGALVVGIAGRGNTGKDTLAVALARLFEDRATACVSEGNYRRFSAEGPMGRRVTELDPVAHHLERFGRDVGTLLHGRPLHCWRYEQDRQRFVPSMDVQASELVVVSGHHGLRHRGLRRRFDASVFLEVEEGLRQRFESRAMSGFGGGEGAAPIEARARDYAVHVRPQREVADLVFRLEPLVPEALASSGESSGAPRAQLRVITRRDLPFEEVVADFLAIGDVDVPMIWGPSERDTELLFTDDTIEPPLVADIAERHIPHLEQVLSVEPRWEKGLLGVMQLFVLLQLSEHHRSWIHRRT